MCDIHVNGRKGWLGWRRLPVNAPAMPMGSWHDLSHRLDNALPVPHVFPSPHFGRVQSMPEKRLNVTQIEMVCHVGTHVDAPLHLFMDGPGFDEIPQHMLHGHGVVWELNVKPFEAITAKMLAEMRPAMKPGDMVVLCTGWSEIFGTDQYMSNPALTVQAAEWLVDKGVKALGVDFATPDMALSQRPEDFDWPVHKVLLGQGALVIENLTNVKALAGKRVEFVVGALNIVGADGSPARIFAREISS